MIIDCHGHFTTAPAALGDWRQAQIAALDGGPQPADPNIGDEDLREAIESNQLRLMDERGIDLTVFSPRASFMAHHVGDAATSSRWAAICNDLIARVSELFPERFATAAMLPQSPGVDPAECLPELRRAVEELDAVAINLNPDPSGGLWDSPPLTDRSWYPIYEAMCEYDIPAMVHVSTSVNPAFHTTGAHYLNADTTAFMQLVQGDLFADFPDLKLIIPHGGGAAPYHWGRFRGLAMALGKPELEEHVMRNVYFDTCVYHQPGIDLLFDVVPNENILFASEMIGAVRDVDPCSGHYFDDTGRYIEGAKLPDAEREAVLEGNTRRVYPRLDARLKRQGR
ncbi:amidohydrolase family protein [Nocardiopsis sp. JB363]|uniref:amidohydrolase family protein n=1 Tax=Nocardiopsis sp. JB363 TaxID=1434837 RepID=UPI00097B87AC|nr:amidohydrolase family protein [Nocardiopsis sp. JB363]SIO84416.1 4-oxalomesaconate hydratase [Nocardiopsis sp. JB363]